MIKTTGNIAASANIVKESVVMGDVSIGEGQYHSFLCGTAWG